MTKIQDIDLVNYIINQKKTGKEAAEFFGVSLSTVRKRLANIKNDLSPETSIYQELEQVAKINEQVGKITGGLSKNSGKKKSLTLEQITRIAMDMLAFDLTVEEAANKYFLPSSTLAENLENLNSEEYFEMYQDLRSMFEAHRLKRSSKKLQEKYLEKISGLEQEKKK